MATSSLDDDQADQLLAQGIVADRLSGASGMSSGSSSSSMTVAQFYTGRSIFITGGTGFMGKVSIHYNNEKYLKCIINNHFRLPHTILGACRKTPAIMSGYSKYLPTHSAETWSRS